MTLSDFDLEEERNAKVTLSAIDRFWTHVDKSGGPSACWPWQGSKDRDGYGLFKVKSHKTIGAHKFALLTKTILAFGQVARHLECDNPPCCNPDHLSWGSVDDNRADAVKKQRMCHGEKHHKARLTVADVVSIRSRFVPGKGVAALAAEFNISEPGIWNVIARRTWRHVP